MLDKKGLSLAPLIDHTLLKPGATPEEVKILCREAIQYGFATVCVDPMHVGLAATLVRDSSVKPITVVGFPLGTSPTEFKVKETRAAIQAGAMEIDMVIQLKFLKEGLYSEVFHDIRAVVEAAHPIPVKVILETCELNHDQKIIACALSKAAGAAFVKTSTGFGAGGATPEDVALMRRIVGPTMGVKASGGIRTYEDAQRMVEAGASRLGTSSSIKIVNAR